MQKELITIFSEPKLQELIEKTETQFQMNSEEDISLKSLLLSTYLLTRNENSIYLYFETIVSGILKERGKNNYQTIMDSIIDDLFKENHFDFKLSTTLLNNFFYEGYAFHSFNSAFLPTILERGLTLEQKPWDNDKIENIRKLFSSRNIKSVFGLYQGRKETPLFFSNKLESSRFYAYSSPTWFRHFVSGGMYGKEYDKSAFFRRDYNAAKSNVIKLCQEACFEQKTQEDILDFFEEQWKWLGTEELPCVALVKQEELKSLPIVPVNNASALDYTKQIFQMFGSQNHIIKQNIEPNKIVLFSYDLSKLKAFEQRKISKL